MKIWKGEHGRSEAQWERKHDFKEECLWKDMALLKHRLLKNHRASLKTWLNSFEDLGKNMFSTSLQITKRRILILNEKLKFTGTSSLPDCSFPKIISVWPPWNITKARTPCVHQATFPWESTQTTPGLTKGTFRGRAGEEGKGRRQHLQTPANKQTFHLELQALGNSAINYFNEEKQQWGCVKKK